MKYRKYTRRASLREQIVKFLGQCDTVPTSLQIAHRFNCSRDTAYRTLREWQIVNHKEFDRQTRYRGQLSLRVRVFPVFEERGGDVSFRELAEQFNCTESGIRRVWEIWVGREDRREKAQCTRCGFYEWEQNPILQDGRCLWCHAQIARVDLGELVTRCGWEAVIAVFQEGGMIE